MFKIYFFDSLGAFGSLQIMKFLKAIRTLIQEDHRTYQARL